MVLISKHIQRWKEAKGELNTVESQLAQTSRHLKSSQSVTVTYQHSTAMLELNNTRVLYHAVPT